MGVKLRSLAFLSGHAGDFCVELQVAESIAHFDPRFAQLIGEAQVVHLVEARAQLDDDADSFLWRRLFSKPR